MPERITRRRLIGRAMLGAAALPLSGCARETETMQAEPLGDDIEAVSATGGGVRLHALAAGRGRPVVLIHGASGNARDWTFGALQAMARDHRVIAFDRPGLGRSALPAPGGENPFVQAEAMAEALAALGHRAPILIGHSYGGSVALAWALARPRDVAGLLLLAAPSQVWPGGVGLSNDILASDLLGPILAPLAPTVIPRSFLRAAAERIFAPQTPPEGYVARLGVDAILAPAALRANARQLTALKGFIETMVPRYPGLPMPIEILHGDADDTVPLDIHSIPLADQVLRGNLVVLEGIGHMPHHAALEPTLAALARLDAAAYANGPPR